MVLYGITLVPLEEELWDVDTNLISTLYTDDAAFDGSERRSASQLCLLMNEGTDQGYFPEPAKSLFIAKKPKEKEAARQEFERVGLHLTYIYASRYLWTYLGPREDL